MKKRFRTILIAVLFCIVIPLCLSACSTKPSSLKFDAKDYNIYIAETFTPKIKAVPFYAKYTLSSSNPTIISIDGDKIIGVKEGIVTITATSGSKVATSTLAVLEKPTDSTDPSNPDAKTHIISFVSDHISFPSQQVPYDKLPIKPNEPEVLGYQLENFYADAACTTIFDFTLPLSRNTIVYAKWVLSTPNFKFSDPIDGTTTIKELSYKALPYISIAIPEFDNNGNKVVGIDEMAFTGTKTLENIFIPASVTSIGKDAFYNCPELKTVTFDGNNLKTIKVGAFASCSKLTNLVLPTSLTSIEDRAFQNCSELNILSLPSGITTLSQDVFLNTAIVKVDLSYITEIGIAAFQNCKKLETVINSSKIEGVGRNAFYNTPFINNQLNSSNRVAFLDDILLKCNDTIKSYTVPTTVRLIASEAFSSLKNALITFKTAPIKKGIDIFNPGSNTLIIVDNEHFNTYINNTNWKIFANLVHLRQTIQNLDIVYREKTAILYKYVGTGIESIDVKQILSDYNLINIRTGAFSSASVNSDTTLKEVILPAGDYTIEDQAFTNMKALRSVKILGTPGIPTIVPGSFQTGTLDKTNFKLYVDNTLLPTYISKYGNYTFLKGRIVTSN